MPTARIPANEVMRMGLLMAYQGRYFLHKDRELRRRLTDYLAARGFTDGPLAFTQDGDTLLVEQEEPEGRIKNNSPKMTALLQRLRGGDAAAVGAVYQLMVANDDDRAEAFSNVKVDIVEDAVFGADTGGTSEGHTEQQVSSEMLAGRMLCKKALLFLEGK